MSLRLILAAATLAVCAALPVHAQEAFTNLPTIIISQVASNTTSTMLSIRQGRGMAIAPHFAGTNAGTAVITIAFELSVDGSTWATEPLRTASFAMDGATAVVGYTNFPASALDNARYIRMKYITNAHTASVFLTNVVWSVVY